MLDFTLALTFIVPLVPVLTDRPSVAAALRRDHRAGRRGLAVQAGAGRRLPLVGIAVGAWLDRGPSRGSEQEQTPLSAGEEV